MGYSSTFGDQGLKSQTGERVVFNGYGSGFEDDDNIGRVGTIVGANSHYIQIELDGGPGLWVLADEISPAPAKQSLIAEVGALMDEYDATVHEYVPTATAIAIVRRTLDFIESQDWEPSVEREAYLRLAVGFMAIAQGVEVEEEAEVGV